MQMYYLARLRRNVVQVGGGGGEAAQRRPLADHGPQDFLGGEEGVRVGEGFLDFARNDRESYLLWLISAWAAAKRAMGTRNGLQET